MATNTVRTWMPGIILLLACSLTARAGEFPDCNGNGVDDALDVAGYVFQDVSDPQEVSTPTGSMEWSIEMPPVAASSVLFAIQGENLSLGSVTLWINGTPVKASLWTGGPACGTRFLEMEVPAATFNGLAGSDAVLRLDVLSQQSCGTGFLAVATQYQTVPTSEDHNANLVPDECELTVTAAVSRKPHGLAGDFDLDLLEAGAVECRANGPTIIVVTFDQPVQRIHGTTADVSLSTGSVADLTVGDSSLTLQITGAGGPAAFTLGFPGVVGLQGQTVVSPLCSGVLAGDVTGDRVVNVFDLIAVRNRLNQPVASDNFLADVNADGLINIFDLIAVRENLNTSAPTCSS